jgi:DNA-directed RNA polymerase specialized sigma24 family protein
MNWQVTHDEWEGKIIARIAGELDAEESALVDRHAQSCNVCSPDLKEYELLSRRLQMLEKDIEVPDLSPALVALKQEIAQHRAQEEALSAETETSFSDEPWKTFYPQLYAQAKHLVHQSKVADWSGQEEDVAKDIVQESMCRVFEYTQKVERGERKPIQSLMALLTTVALNYYRDLLRRERRLTHVPTDQLLAEMESIPPESISEVATEDMYHEYLFRSLAHQIASFPTKQRQALLVDLAGRMAFGEKPSILQAAFQDAGILLEEYQHPLPESERERGRHRALVYHAYRRLKDLAEQRYLAV